MFLFLPGVIVIGIVVPGSYARPEQVHLSLCKERDCMSINWVTMSPEPDQQLWFARDQTNLSHWRAAETTKWTFRGKTRYMHKKRIYNLRYDMTYYYRVGNNQTKSKIFHFKTFPQGDNFPFKTAVVGDLGVKGKALPYMIKAAQNNKFRMVILIGDIAYNLHTNQGTRGDEFMNMIEPIAAYMPFMIISGNHEDDGEDFANVRYRFDMPNSPRRDNQYYSFKVGPVQFVAVSTEQYVMPKKYGRDYFDKQYNWLKAELSKANSNRGAQPWLVTYQHRPIYCSNRPTNRCRNAESWALRYGTKTEPGLEPLYNKNSVDINFAGHHHDYERYYPRSGRYYSKTAAPYFNPLAPIYIISGNGGGSYEHHSSFDNNPSIMSAKRITDNGYTVMSVHNKTHLYLRHLSVEKGEKEVDGFWVKKALGWVPKFG